MFVGCRQPAIGTELVEETIDVARVREETGEFTKLIFGQGGEAETLGQHVGILEKQGLDAGDGEGLLSNDCLHGSELHRSEIGRL